MLYNTNQYARTYIQSVFFSFYSVLDGEAKKSVKTAVIVYQVTEIPANNPCAELL